MGQPKRRLRPGYILLGEASRTLGVPRRTLSRWLASYAVHCDEFVRKENGERLDLWWQNGVYTVRKDGVLAWKRSKNTSEAWLYESR